MKPTILIAIGIGCACFAILSGAEESKLPQQNQSKLPIQEKLKAFENGTIGLEELTEDGVLRQLMICYYTNHPENVSIKAKLAVSRSFVMEHDFQRAAQLAEEYVAVYSNDYRGWRLVGAANSMQNRSDRAMEAYTRAVALGDETCLSSLAAAAVEAHRLDVVRGIVPQLLRQKQSVGPPKFVKLEILGTLSFYAEKVGDKATFVKALEGEKAEDILSRTDIATQVDETCQKLQAAEVEVLCRQIHEAMQRKSAAKHLNEAVEEQKPAKQ
jgi:tetratricopeptide (TPR) repeat protein